MLISCLSSPFWHHKKEQVITKEHVHAERKNLYFINNSACRMQWHATKTHMIRGPTKYDKKKNNTNDIGRWGWDIQRKGWAMANFKEQEGRWRGWARRSQPTDLNDTEWSEKESPIFLILPALKQGSVPDLYTLLPTRFQEWDESLEVALFSKLENFQNSQPLKL